MEAGARLVNVVVVVVVGAVEAGEDDLVDAHVEVGEHVNRFGNVVAQLGVFREWVWENGPEVGSYDAEHDDSKPVGEDYVRRIYFLPSFHDGCFSQLSDLELVSYHDDRGYKGNDPYT